MNQGRYSDPNSQTDPEEIGEDPAEKEAELTNGFTFDVTPAEAKELGVDDRKVGDECDFEVTASVINVAEDGTLTFKASEIEWEPADDEDAESSDMVGASSMYKAGMGYKADRNKVQYVKAATEPAAG